LFMLIAVTMTVVELTDALGLSMNGLWSSIQSEGLGQIFFFEGGWSDSNNFFKQFLAGMFIAIVMTGLDQDMMQKNLTCRNIGEAQKNMFSFSIVLVFVNFFFLMLGALLAMYALQNGIVYERADSLYPTIALEHLPWGVGVTFIIGLVAAAYSSADSALAALTTSFCVDFLGFKTNKNEEEISQPHSTTILDSPIRASLSLATQTNERTRYWVHIGFSVVLFLVIVLFWWINDDSVVVKLFTFAGYTYGPLLGLYTFGLFTNRKVKDNLVPLICLVAPVLTYLITSNSEALLWGYKFGFELLLVNGLLTFVGLWAITDKSKIA